nr:endoribonuclease Dicer homolog 2 [Tanacetum cinerariifolium]
MTKHTKRSEDGTVSFTIQVEAEGRIYKETCRTQDKKMAERLASKSVLKLIKEKKLPGLSKIYASRRRILSASHV